MKINKDAEVRLKRLLGKHHAFRYLGHLGSCRGSTPVLRPTNSKKEGEVEIKANGITFFVTDEHIETLDVAVFDYDPSFMGKGLTVTWHKEGCNCS